MNKRKFFGAILIITALIVMLLPATEADAESSASNFTIKSGKLIKYNGTQATVSVPTTVTSIGEGAFENNTTVEKIILPDSVKQIDAYAFWGCENLRTVTLGKGLTVIEDFVFMNCTGLETMTIPSNVHSIGTQAFAGCTRFEDITIPPQVTDIREDAFDGDYLLNIHCETGSYADKYAQEFYERQKEMTVYDNTNSGDETDKPKTPSKDGVYSGADIENNQSDKNDTYEEIPGTVLGTTKVVGNQAVVLMQSAGIDTQDSSMQGPDSEGETENPAKIAERSHYRDEKFTRENLQQGVKEIGQFAYARSGLINISLPDGLETIDYAAFYHCDNLTAVEIPESVTSVAPKAFAHTAWVDNFLSGAGENTDFLISGGVLVAYRGDAEEVTVPEGVRVIAGEAFADHDEIRKVILPVSLQNIDERAFAGCNPEKVEYHGDAMDEDVVQKSVSIQAFGAATPSVADRKFPFTWIAAAVMLIGGCVVILRRTA